MVNLTSTVKSRIASSNEDIKRTRAGVATLRSAEVKRVCLTLQGLDSWSDVISVGFYTWHSNVEITLNLDPEKTNSGLVRDIVRSGLISKMDKRQAWSGGYLVASGQVSETIRIEVTNYVPETCRIEYEEVVVPEHTERKARVICQD